MAALHHVGDPELVAARRSAGSGGDSAKPSRSGCDPVEAHADADVPADDVGDGERALHDRPELVALLDVLEIARRGAAVRFARVERVDRVERLLRVGLGRRRRRPLLRAPAPSRARCGSSAGTGRRAARPPRPGRPARSTRAPPVRRTRSACPGTPTRAFRRRTRVAREQRRPPLAEAARVEGVHAAERIAAHQLALVRGAPRRPRPRRSACRRRRASGGAIDAAPARSGAVGRIAEERIVVAVGVRDVAEGVLVGGGGSAAVGDAARGRRCAPAAARSPRP